MKKLFIIAACLCLCLPSRAYELSTDADQTDKQYSIVELRQSAGANFNLGKQWDIALCEEIREVVYDSGNTPTAYFAKSYTTLEAGWKFLSLEDTYNGHKYSMKLNAGYTLRYLHQKQAIRHRPFVSLSGTARFGMVKLSLRERFLIDCRTDSVNPLEQAQNAMELRHRLTADVTIPGKTYKPFAFIEFANTLNAPSCTNSAGVQLYGGQYLNAVRTRVGVHWKVTPNNTLSFAYSFQYGQSREVNITRKSQEINRLYMERTLRHAITVAYDFGL